ncbi:histone-lysine N-methyltransferase ASHH2 [Selaginella moellendorffii]|uniref:histone-lysine N-methyltransferase ASHH2 n=1 Tax=Selaginella moellendorffii TaxID=88036 RepID=UPI000D1C7035|nr:histone-lysine N-methyltransferase ASHH2 [Selaginella moellendorffii]|eukprot:XP_002980990.2 histone-lysine N-methyltransferase ASHH2 [Selaginella moellendorffii]
MATELDSQGATSNSCNGVCDELTLSPSFLEHSYTPMRITRSKASLRMAFAVISGGETTTNAPTAAPVKNGASVSGKNGSNGSVKNGSSNGSSTSVVIRRTGKRSVSRGLRSGWSSKPGKVVDAPKASQKKSGSTGSRSRGLSQLKISAGDGSVKLKLTAANDADSGHGGEDVSSGVTEGETTRTSNKADAPVLTKVKPSAVGWVMCDDCRKWRCISAELADSIESSDIRWTCRENPNRKFSDCSVPQEKSNAEINAELNISEISSSECDDNEPAVNSKCGVSWTQIRHNIFQHRHQKTLDDDDTLICLCKPPKDGSPGCGEDCLNRMVNVECSPDTCPCGERCSNQQFGKREYSNVALVRCGKKGFGLKALENIAKGSFVIEYVGEVLDSRSFELRQKEYARQRQKHFYFMTLNSSEVIDACRKGNLGRFINHSCEPNCQTEKWCVNGEICIGLFAIRDVAKNEEITFNYNFERLYGAAAKKCHCGSAHCRGYIGGDPSNPRDVVQTDSEEDLEPIMLKDDESEDEDIVDTEVVQETPKSCTPPEALFEEPKPELLVKEIPIPKPKPLAKVKRPKPSGRPKKVPFKGFFSSNKSEGYRPSRYSEVEDKLDKLLNDKGGLVKKKETPKQYLKLLVISTASGDESKEGTSCSMRDLSLLLDAMLKTTSRSILTEVIQKNGLQLLHNLVKQSRKSYTKIPILRKLMKVLEALAEKTVLKSKHMTSTPPRNGMESFVKSIFELTRHDDIEVQQISRRFQKNWLPNMFDLLANEKCSESPKFWGPERFSQKRELFRSSKPEEKPRRPLLFRNDSNDAEGKNSTSEQDRKRRRRMSRWDELPSTQDPVPALTSSTPSTSTPSTQHSSSPLQEQAVAPALIDETVTEFDRAEPPGYSSTSPHSNRYEQPRSLSQQHSQQHYDHCSSSSHHQQYQSRGDHWNAAPPFRPPHRPEAGNGYMGRHQHHSQQGQGYHYHSEMPPRGSQHSSPSGPYLPGMPPQHQHQHQHQAPKYQNHHHHPQPVRPPLNGCYNNGAHHFGPPPHYRGTGGYYPAQQQQENSYHHHQQADEEPPVPGL